MKDNWITIWDNTKEAKLLYVSESITDSTGWEPEEVIGRDGYDLFHPVDHASLRKVNMASIYNEKMSTMVAYRYLTKDGSYVWVETIIHYCHDVLVGSNYIYDPDSLGHKIRANTVDEVFTCLPDGTLQLAGAWNDKQDQLKMSLSSGRIWEDSSILLNQEHRFCLILNRFVNNANIVYVSKLASELVSLDPTTAIGTSLYQFVLPKDAPSLKAQIDLSKEHDMVVRLRFDWLIDLERGLTEPVEAVVSSTDDGIVMVFRLSPRLFVED